MDWITLTSEEEVRNIVEDESHKSVCVIFKHSTTCPVSSIAYQRLKDFSSEDSQSSFKFYYLDLLAHRPVSNYVADLLQVHHESPQVILVHKGEVTYDESHLGITSQELTEQIRIVGA